MRVYRHQLASDLCHVRIDLSRRRKTSSASLRNHMALPASHKVERQHVQLDSAECKNIVGDGFQSDGAGMDGLESITIFVDQRDLLRGWLVGGTGRDRVDKVVPEDR